jgi:hypothetical protein
MIGISEPTWQVPRVEIERGHLVCVDFRPTDTRRPGRLRFVFQIAAFSAMTRISGVEEIGARRVALSCEGPRGRRGG